MKHFLLFPFVLIMLIYMSIVIWSYKYFYGGDDE